MTVVTVSSRHPPVSPAARLTALSVLAPAPQLRATYRRFVLISHSQHLDTLDIGDVETLVVSTDWLAWRKWVDRGGHGVHFEATMELWPADAGDPHDHYLRSVMWMYVDGKDVTQFRGISLGKQFMQDVALFSKGYQRLWHGLARLIVLYRPTSLVLVDLQLENQMLDDAAKLWLVENLADHHGLHVEQRLASPDPYDPLCPDVPHVGIEPEETGWRVWFRQVYSRTVDMLFRVVSPRAQRRPKIYISANWQVIEPLIENCRGRRVTMMVPAGQCPKTPDFLWRCWRNNVVLVHLPNVALTAAERAEIDAIGERLTKAWKAQPAAGVEAACRHFISVRVIARGWMYRRAKEMKGYQLLFRRHRCTRMVIGDAGNANSRLLAEAAHQTGTPIDEMPNGMFLSEQKLCARTGDGVAPPLLSRFLPWGEQQERWLQAQGAPLPCIRVGYPGLDLVRRAAPTKPLRRNRALVLGPWIDGYDVIGLHSCKASYLVEIVRGLRDLNVPEIRVKLHPGTPNLSYYTAAMRHYGIECEVTKKGRLTPHVEWADFVIGPASSGSLVETHAAGKPYYAIRHYPSLMGRDYTDRAGAFESAADLIDALRRDWTPDREDILEYFCSFSTYPNASARLWDVMEASVTGPC